MQKYFVEFIGTFSLVLLGCGTAAIAGPQVGLAGIALSFGFTVAVMVYAFGSISGCHINPAVTVAMLVAGKIRGANAIAYIMLQLLGATSASVLLWLIQQGAPGFTRSEWALGANGWGAGYGGGYAMLSAFLAEAVFTFLFLLVIFAVTAATNNKRVMAGLAIGLALTVIHLAGIPITGVSVNPARSFGPALVAGGKALEQLWLFWAAPLVGACLAAWLWKKSFE